MTDWATRITNHAASTDIAALTPMLTQAQARAGQDVNASQLLARMRAIQEAAVATLNLADPLLVADQVLSGISNNAQAWRGQLTSYVDNGNVGHLQSALGNADGVSVFLAQIPVLNTGRPQQVAAATRAYHAAMQRYIDEVETRSREASARATALASRLEQIEGQAVQAASQMQSTANAQQQQFSQAQEERVNEFGRAQNARANEFVTVIAELRTASDALVHDQEASFAQFRSDVEERLADLINTADQTARAVQEEIETRGNAIVAGLERRQKEADDLVGIIAERGVTSHYQKVADAAKNAMWFWQGITVAALAALVAAAIFEFLPALRNGWNWGVMAGRLFVTIAVTLLATYAGAEARENQKVMRENRQREMDLAAVGPYLESLPEAERNEFKLKLADRTFAPMPPALPERAAVPVGSGDDFGRVTSNVIALLSAAKNFASK